MPQDRYFSFLLYDEDFQGLRVYIQVLKRLMFYFVWERIMYLHPYKPPPCIFNADKRKSQLSRFPPTSHEKNCETCRKVERIIITHSSIFPFIDPSYFSCISEQVANTSTLGILSLVNAEC